MAKVAATKSPKNVSATRADAKSPGEEPADRTIQGPVLGRENYVLLGVALLVIAAGFIALGQGSITIAPILLVVGYLVLLPMAIVKRTRSGE